MPNCGGWNMEQEFLWTRHRMKCPEGLGESDLLLKWRVKGKVKVLDGVECDNTYLKDLSGGDCQWSCWEKIPS